MGHRSSALTRGSVAPRMTLAELVYTKALTPVSCAALTRFFVPPMLTLSWISGFRLRSCVDDGVWSKCGEERSHGGQVGDVSVMVRHGGASIAIQIGAQVENCDLCLRMALDDVVDNVAT
jgi:hypothetical protein